MEQLRLLTLGGLNLLVGGKAVTGAMTQRRRMALLALLAVARDRGLNRDKIQAYLWPESDTERARRGLNQLLYVQRLRAPDGDLFLGKKTPRLNPAMITCDVWEFDDALDRGDLEAGVRLYAGPFLDGFFVRGAPGLERWIDEQRDRLARRSEAAIASLAAAATGKGDHRQALLWWCRGAELNPFDAETVLRVMEAAVACGDRAAALRSGQHHIDLLRTELNLAPDPRVTQAIERLRHS